MPIIKPSNQNVTVVATSNTTQGTFGTQAISNIVMAGAGNVSVGVTNGSIVVSGANDGVNIIAAGTQTAGTAGTVLFNNSNGISFGMSNSVVTASHDGLVQSVADALYQPKFAGEPNGFVDRTKTTLAWSNASRTLTIAPIGSYEIYSNGTKFIISTTKTFTISNVDGAHYIYIDDTGTLQEYIGTFDDLLIFKWCYVAYVYWDTANAVAVPDAQNEQHGAEWPAEIHYQQHKTVGTRFESGADLSITLGSGSLDLDVEFASTVGYIFDEDIRHEITARATSDLLPILYRNGATGAWKHDETLSALTRSVGSGRAAFNEFTGSTWQRTEMLDGWYGTAYIYAAPGITKRWFAVMGQAQYPNIDDARTAATTVPVVGSTLPFVEFKLVASVIFQTNNTFSNTTKSRLEAADDAGSKFVDWRQVSQTAPSAPLPYQTPVNIVAAGSTFSSGTATFGNANGFSFVGSNGSIVGSYTVPAAPAQTVQTQGLVSVLGSSGAILFANGNGVSFGGNLNTVTASVGAGATATGNFGALGAGTQTVTSGTVSFANSNGISFGMSGSNRITASYTVPVVPVQTVQTLGGYALGNTTGQSSSSTFDARSLSFSGAGVASIGYSGNAVIISVPSGGGAGDGVNILAAGTQTANTTGTVAFVNSNNVSFGMSNSSHITASFSYSQSTAPSAISAGTTQATSGQVVLSNSNGISFGMNAGTVTASYTVPTVPAQTVQTQGLVSVLGSSGAISFANGNGVSFGGNLNTVTASVGAGATATGNFGAMGAGTQTATSGTVSFANSNGISFGMSGSNQITASYTVPTQTVQSYNVLAAGTQTANTTGTVSFVNSNNVSFGLSNSSQLTASFSYSQSTAPSAISAGTTQATSGAVVFSNSNGVSFGMNAGTVTASYTVPTQTVQTQGLVSVIGSSGAISFANGNGVSFGGNLNTVTASVGAGATATGNFGALGAGTQTATAGTVSFANSNGISFGMSGSNQITASYTVPTVPAGATATGNFGALGAGTQTATSGTVSFANSNNISFGMSGSNQITASFSYSQSTAPSAISAGTTQATSGQVVLANSNGISFGMNAGTVTASYTVPAVPAQTAQTLGGYVGGNTTGQSSSTTVDARSLSFSGAGIVSVGYSAGSVIISAVAAGAGDGVNILAAGTQTATSNGTVQFVDSNGISFGMSNNSRITASYTVPAQTAQTIGGYAVGNTVGQSSSSTADARSYSVSGAGIVSIGYSAGVMIVSAVAAGAGDGVNILAAGTQTATSNGTVAFVNSNNVTFGMSNSSQITASFSYSQSTAPSAISAGTAQATSGQVVLGNSNGISFGMNAGTVTASYTVPAVPAQTVQTQGLVSVLGSSGAISFANGNGVSFGGNLNTVTASVAAGATATGNFGALGAGTQTATSGTVSFANSNGISFGMSGSNQITASYTVPTQTVQSYNILAAGTQTANTTGTVAFVNSNNVSFGLSNSSQLTASFSYSQSTAPSAISAGTTQATSGQVVFSNSNGISFGMNAGTVTASYTVPTQSVQTQGLVSVLGSSGAISFANGNGVSFGGNLNTVTASVGAGATATGNFGALGAGTQTVTSGTVSFANSNGISFGMSGSNQITASYTVPTVGAGATATGNFGALGAGTQTATSGTVVFANSNGISFGMSGSNQITASYTVPAQTVQTIGAYAISNTTGQSSSSTMDARSMPFVGAGVVSVGYSAGSVVISAPSGGGAGDGVNILAAGTQTANTTGTVAFIDSNGISFGMTNSSQITASVLRSELTAGANITLSVGGSTVSIVGNNPVVITAGTNSFSSGAIQFANSNGISFGLNTTGVLTASHNGLTSQSNQTLGLYASGNTTGQSSSSVFDARTISFYGGGIASVGYSAGSVVISVPSGGGVGDGVNILAAGTQTANTTGTVLFANSNGVTFGMDANSVITASVAAGGGGGGGVTWSYFNPTDGALQVAGQQGQGTLHIQPAQIQNVQFDHIAFPVNFSGATNSTGTLTISQWFGLYTRNASTLSLASSTLLTQAITHSGTASSTVNNGMRLFTGGWTDTILEGQYYVGILSRTTSGGANATISQMLVSQINTVFSGILGQASVTSAQYTRGLGIYSATTSGMPASIGFNQINGTGTLGLRRPLFYLYSQTF